MIHCSSCNIRLEDSPLQYHRIETPIAVYYTCLLCLSQAVNKLKKIKKRTTEESILLKQLQLVLNGKVISA